MGQYTEGSQAIIDAVGGADNIDAVTNCITRLRFALPDESKADQAAPAANDLVQGSFAAGGQYQVIIGPGTVEKVVAEIRSLTGIGEMSKADVAAAGAENLSALQRGIKVLADIFIPLLPATPTRCSAIAAA